MKKKLALFLFAVLLFGYGKTNVQASFSWGDNDDSKNNISECVIELSDECYIYDGTAKEPTVTVKDGTEELTINEDYTVLYVDNIKVGTATVTITGTGEYTGDSTVNFTITAKDISACIVTLSCNSYTYDGTEKKPGVTVVDTDRGVTLTEGTDGDYTVSYSDNKNVGEATVIISGLGNYTGEIKAYFTIQEAETSDKDISSCTATLSTQTYTYDGTEKQPDVTVMDDSITLTLGTDYNVTYSNNVYAGTATVTITGIGSYTGTITDNFTIAKAAISDYPSSSISLNAYRGQTLADVSLPSGFAFVKSKATSVGSVGTNSFEVNYSDAMKAVNYNNKTVSIKVTISDGGKVNDLIEAMNITPDNVTKTKINNVKKLVEDYDNLSSDEKAYVTNSNTKKIEKLRAIEESCERCGVKKKTKVYYCYFESSKTLVIFGSGKMKNYFDTFDSSKLKKNIKKRSYQEYASKAETVIIKGKVAQIGNGAFANFTELQTLEIEASKNITIGKAAFANCGNLKTVNMKKVKEIQFGGFLNCSSLKNVTLPNSLKTLGKSAFYGCSSLKTITLSKNLKSIGDYCFGKCKKLKTITVKGKITTCGNYIFFKANSKKKNRTILFNKGKNSNLVTQAKKAGFTVKSNK